MLSKGAEAMKRNMGTEADCIWACQAIIRAGNATMSYNATGQTAIRQERIHTPIAIRSWRGFSHISRRFGEVASWVEKKTRYATRQPAMPQMPKYTENHHLANFFLTK